MSQIDCYEPEYVRLYLQQHLSPERETFSINWQHETRLSLILDDVHCCEAVLGSPDAFTLQVRQTLRKGDFPALPPLSQALNQVAIDIVTLPTLSLELRLYALGVMISCAQKKPDDIEAIKAFPAELAHHAATGTLKHMFELLPSLAIAQRERITRLGSLSIEWEELIECSRKMSLPLQIRLLSLQDINSEALMQQQLQDVWDNRQAGAFVDMPWIWTNYLVYRLYHDTFPHHDDLSPPQRYLELVSDYFLLRTLCCLWMIDGTPLTRAECISLFRLFEGWRHSYPHEHTTITRSSMGDELLTAISLLTR